MEFAYSNIESSVFRIVKLLKSDLCWKQFLGNLKFEHLKKMFISLSQDKPPHLSPRGKCVRISMRN